MVKLMSWVTRHTDIKFLSIFLHGVIFSSYCVFTQFSALFPEMVDAVVLLDALGFLPTDPVLYHFFIITVQNMTSLYSKDDVIAYQCLWKYYFCIPQLQSCSCPVSSFWPSDFFSLQEEIFKVMKQGIDEMLQHEKNTEKTTRVYSYEKAVERYLIAPVYDQFRLNRCRHHHLWRVFLTNIKGQVYPKIKLHFYSFSPYLYCFYKHLDNLEKDETHRCLLLLRIDEAREHLQWVSKNMF